VTVRELLAAFVRWPVRALAVLGAILMGILTLRFMRARAEKSSDERGEIQVRSQEQLKQEAENEARLRKERNERMDRILARQRADREREQQPPVVTPEAAEEAQEVSDRIIREQERE